MLDEKGQPQLDEVFKLPLYRREDADTPDRPGLVLADTIKTVVHLPHACVKTTPPGCEIVDGKVVHDRGNKRFMLCASTLGQ